MKIHRVLPLTFAVVACASQPEPATPEAPPVAAAPEAPALPAPAETAAPAAETAPAPEAPAVEKVEPLQKPAAKWAVDGVSLSEIDEQKLLEAFQKAKLTDASAFGSSTGNGYVSLTLPIAKGTAKGTFTLVRPAKEATEKNSLAAPETLSQGLDAKKAIGTLDKDADVFFNVTLEQGTAAEAKKILDAVIKPAK